VLATDDQNWSNGRVSWSNGNSSEMAYCKSRLVWGWPRAGERPYHRDQSGPVKLRLWTTVKRLMLEHSRSQSFPFLAR